jgi:hypothetical protein
MRGNMSFRAVSVTEQLVYVMHKQGKKLGDEIKELKEGVESGESGEGEEELGAMEVRWGKGGEIVRARGGYGRQASVVAMTQFEQYWLNCVDAGVLQWCD